MRINVPARAQSAHCTVNLLVTTDDKAQLADVEEAIKDAARQAIMRSREELR